MSLSLICPNCGAEVGIYDNGKEKYFYKDENGEPDCNNCHANNAVNVEKWLLIGTIICFILIPFIFVITNL